MSGRAKVLLTIAAFSWVMPVAAQAPAPTTAFDGVYQGVSREVSKYVAEGKRCGPSGGVPPPLEITNGVARTQGDASWEGTVNPQGALVMRLPNAARVDAQIDNQGTIRGQFSTTRCTYTYVCQKQLR